MYDDEDEEEEEEEEDDLDVNYSVSLAVRRQQPRGQRPRRGVRASKESSKMGRPQ